MSIYLTSGLLFAYFALPGILLGDLAFQCPSCNAELQAACPKLPEACPELVREPGCGCCPLCARQEGELCGVYTPRCSGALRCYPSTDSELPLQQLIRGLGRCGRQVDLDVTTSLDPHASDEVHGTKRPALDVWNRQESARKQHQNVCKTKMKKNPLQAPQTRKVLQSACQQELNSVLEEISKITSEDNRGPLEDLYLLKFPNCDKDGLYNLKQCNMSTHGQRGECWCVNPFTGVQTPTTPKVRGDPNCNQFQEETRELPTASVFH